MVVNANTNQAYDFSPFPERAIGNYEDWRAFAQKPTVTKPHMPTYDQYEAMSTQQKRAFNQERAFYHSAFGPIFVPAMEKIHEAALRLTTQNLRAAPGARPGIIMDGISTVGKSTIAMQLGRRYEIKATKEFRITVTPAGHTFIPVAYVNLPGEVNIMNFNMILATFYNIPFSRSVKEGHLTKSIKEYASDCATSMFIIDDIHFLKIKNRSHETLNNHIKHLANSISATFIYAGVDLESTGILTEGRSDEKAKFSQNGHRFKKFDLRSYNYDNPKSKLEFLQVLNAFEGHLMLFQQIPQSLSKGLGDYIYARTGGFLGPMSTLIREGATIAIKKKLECITLDVLKGIRLDIDSEEGYKLYKKRHAAATQRMAA